MARTHARGNPPKPKWPLGLLLAICLLLIVIGVIVFVSCHEQQQPPHVVLREEPRTTQPATETAPAPQPPTDLVSDNRTIFGGMPRPKTPGTLNVTVLHNEAYTVGFSSERRTPLWSAYRVIRKEHPFILARPKGDFLTDPRVPDSPTHKDYTGSGYDRGHMTPNSAIARCFGAQAQRETFFLTNICPQAPALNQKVWEHLEVKELDYANQFGEVWVVDGPIFPDLKDPSKPAKKLRSGINVPEAFYKILVHDDSGGKGLSVHACAVIMPQTVKGTELPSQYTTTIDQIEDRTGLEFLWKLPPETQRRLKSVNAPLWPVHPN
jgi:endonuclease G